ncbi:MAG: hypothetical protein IKE24_10225 [Clostridia bacterium]|nr:hypothetical protein [Clostridia bacterium]
MEGKWTAGLMMALAALVLLCGGQAAVGETAGDGTGMDPEDWADQNRVFYEIFVGSFSDSDGDGIGDLRGMIRRMDYLNDGNPESETSLGIGGIWLTPVFPSPSYHKYDVTDYETVDPAFGSEEDLKELIRLCHERDVKLILDLPLNHTGREHAWYRNFLEAHRAGETDSVWYDFYTWIGEGESVPPGRRFMQEEGMLVEANFSDSMPELNYDCAAVREAALKIARKYLEMGVDGFRFDAARYLYLGENDRNISFWGWYMDELRKINPKVYAVAEVWDSETVANLYAKSVNCFRFGTAQAEGLIAKTAKGGNVNRLTKNTEEYWLTIRSINPFAIHIPFISNHDMDRAAGYLQNRGGKMAMAANLYLLTPGSPFIYYGEEIGLRGSRGGAETDANRRLHMQWGDGDTVADPEGSDYGSQTEETVRSQMEKQGSLLKHYQKILRIRREHPGIANGAYQALDFGDTKMGGFLCTWRGNTTAVFHNPTGGPLTVNLAEATEAPLTRIAAIIGTQDEGAAELNGTELTLGAMTSAVLEEGKE